MPRAIISEEEFFRRCYEKHGNKYDYSNIKYIGMGRRIHGIICKKHKIIFSQFASDHAIGKTGCKNCVAEARRLAFQLGNDEFKKRAHKRFGDLFDLSMIKYVNKREKVIIVCKKHGEVLVSPEDFLANEHGCPRCGNAASQANGKGYYSIYKAASRHFCGPGNLYFIRLFSNDENFLKIGVTTDIKRRIRDFKKYGYNSELIFIDEYSDLNDAIIAEFYLHNEFRKYRTKPILTFDGSCECFSMSSLKKITTRLQPNEL